MSYKQLLREAAASLVMKHINDNCTLFGNLSAKEQSELKAAYINECDRDELASFAGRAEVNLQVAESQEYIALLVCMNELKAQHVERLRAEFNNVIEEKISNDLIDRYTDELHFEDEYFGVAA